MEENNSNSIIKVAVVAAIAVILGINVYRTEQCKKEVSELSGIVDGLISLNDNDDLCGTSPAISDDTSADENALLLSQTPQTQSGNEIVEGVSQEQFAELSKSVSRLEAKVATLQGKGQTSGSTTIIQGASKEEFSKLEGSVSTIQSKITALQSKVEQLTRSQTQMATTLKKVTTVSSSTTGTVSSSSSSTKSVSSTSSSSSETTSSTKSTNQKTSVSVAAKVKVEDRYVIRVTYLPKISEGPIGKVVVNITIAQYGSVVSARINPESTISDEDILDACKDAALRTSFSINTEAPSKQTATITYTFTAK